ncbi:MAG TPA: trigger factor, partial [Stellaceae bacterium]|nr:trigger factor [Stellaceae bacterium]
QSCSLPSNRTNPPTDRNGREHDTMNVTETGAEGLKREYTITIPASEVEEQITQRLGEIGRAVRIPGFRPGKVPLPLLRKRFGQAVRGEVLESKVQDSSAETMREHNLRPAMPPKVEIVSAAEGADVEYKMSVEVLPDMPEPDFSSLDLEKLVVDVPEEEVDKAIARLAETHRKTEPVERPAGEGDIIVADVVGRVGEEELPGSRAEGRNIQLGEEGQLPGFSEQLIGAAAGETRSVRITLPADYGDPERAGKEVVFEVAVKEVRERQPAVVDDTLAEAMALENLGELRQEMREGMQRDYNAVARQRLKRVLLDKLAERYDFPVPPGMVDIEFDAIWAEYEGEKEARKQIAARLAERAAAQHPAEGPVDAAALAAPEETALEGGAERAPSAAAAPRPEVPAAERAQERMPAAHEVPHPRAADEPIDAAAIIAPEETALEGASDSEPPAPPDAEDEATMRADFRRIAERRVRLGLLLAEVGRNNNITVSQEELNQALVQEARRHRGYERQVVEFYRNRPDAMNRLRAPIFEDKVVDFIVELARPAERRISPPELLAGEESQEETGATPA